LAALVKEITDAGGRALHVGLDVTDHSQWTAAVDQVRETYGALHILMNIVGTNELDMIPNIDVERWNKVFDINVTSILVGIQTCAPLMTESGGGSIVNIGSVAEITGNFSTAYSSSKWALEGLSRSAAYVLADSGIRRSGKAEQIANTALFLAGDESSYITGTDIVVDGGWFTAAPYLTNERSHDMLGLIRKMQEAGNATP